MYLLGLDIGTGGTRAIVVDESARVVASASAEHPKFCSPEVGWAEQDPEEWWAASRAAIGEVLLVVPANEIGGIGLSGQMHGAVVLDENDRAVRPAIMWCDQRTGHEVESINERIGNERLIDLVANPATTGFTLPKLLWIRDREPEKFSEIRSLILPKDYIRMKLSGVKATDVTDASGTMLFDVAKRQWSSEMMSAFEIDSGILPDVFESVEIPSVVSREGERSTGLKEGTPIVAGAGDNAAGAVGLGVVQPGMLSVTIGTSGVAFLVANAPEKDTRGRIHTMCHAVPGRWHNTGVTQAAGFSLKWYRDTFGMGRSYDDLVAIAAEAPAGSDGLIWLPYLMGERTPHLDPSARAAWIGLTASHGEGHLVRSILEGVAFSLRDSIEIFRELGTLSNSVRLGGGGAKSPLWRKIQADVFELTAETASEDEGAAFGAALLAGVGAGLWSSVDEACDVAIEIADRVEPEPSDILERNYGVFRVSYGRLKPIFQDIARS